MTLWWRWDSPPRFPHRPSPSHGLSTIRMSIVFFFSFLYEIKYTSLQRNCAFVSLRGRIEYAHSMSRKKGREGLDPITLVTNSNNRPHSICMCCFQDIGNISTRDSAFLRETKDIPWHDPTHSPRWPVQTGTQSW